MVSVRSLQRSRVGRALVATRDNPRTAQAYGISLVRLRLVGFAFSGFFAAMAGALYVFHQHTLGANNYRPESSIRIFSMVVFGGLGSLPGVLLGATYFTALDFFVKLQQARFLISGFGLLLALLLVPGGLGQLLYGGRDAILRWVARRRGILVPSLLADVREPGRDREPAPVPH
jgi:branched-chain amino acid transport system permease protein